MISHLNVSLLKLDIHIHNLLCLSEVALPPSHPLLPLTPLASPYTGASNFHRTKGHPSY